MNCSLKDKSVVVHPLTNDPTMAWNCIKNSQKVLKIQPPLPKGPVNDNKVRVVCMSDTHSKTHLMKYEIPHGDIFIHAGDFTSCGEMKEIKQFNEWLSQLPHTYKIVIAGNHELSFDPKFTHPIMEDGISTSSLGYEYDLISTVIQQKDNKKYLTNCIYLEDSMTECFGLKIYGSPWQPVYGGWAFNIPRGQACLDKWNKIPEGIDILVTHSPPLGHGDHCYSGIRAGCVELLSTVQNRVVPKYHIFGHVHEDYGITTDGKIIYINASSCNLQYLPVNHPIIFDIALPEGFTKTSK
ncbi:metallophosphoesterase domain-containing protein 1 [Sipha flava]|uniref:Metallophosphoesterase domain-containing protein 1 n=1 Tax=Sipha flava TaxID=143950 RepID=A0A8B8GG57_9HEMI|nr:metallophosphoesterase domain-containing protein 1 [Sipha flava]XP_025421603.1 metallophosphoesterase domain-containing protein 1 [Sipha flava]XP_025421604.1 metallophosphoesterase domain-containing protein 1 [Sipha flava]